MRFTARFICPECFFSQYSIASSITELNSPFLPPRSATDANLKRRSTLSSITKNIRPITTTVTTENDDDNISIEPDNFLLRPSGLLFHQIPSTTSAYHFHIFSRLV